VVVRRRSLAVQRRSTVTAASGGGGGGHLKLQGREERLRHLEIEGGGGGYRGGSSPRGAVVAVVASTLAPSMANFFTGADKRRWGFERSPVKGEKEYEWKKMGDSGARRFLKRCGVME
jgi:hypothetical protein